MNPQSLARELMTGPELDELDLLEWLESSTELMGGEFITPSPKKRQQVCLIRASQRQGKKSGVLDSVKRKLEFATPSPIPKRGRGRPPKQKKEIVESE